MNSILFRFMCCALLIFKVQLLGGNLEQKIFGRLGRRTKKRGAILGTVLGVQINAVFTSMLNMTDKPTDADY